MENTLPIAQSLVEMRDDKSLTQTEVGRKLGEKLGRAKDYTHARISQIESEGADSIAQIQALAEIYEIPFEYVLAANNRLHKKCK